MKKIVFFIVILLLAASSSVHGVDAEYDVAKKVEVEKSLQAPDYYTDEYQGEIKKSNEI